jgi:hypothetical protein
MKPYQVRVVDECNELTSKIASLKLYLDNGSLMDFNKVPDAERMRLRRQLLIMQLYQEVLAERISAFAADEVQS